MTTFVFKHKGQYCKFGNGQTAIPVEDLTKASCYSTEKLARRKFEDILLNDNGKRENRFWIKGTGRIESSELTLVKVGYVILSEEVVNDG